MMTKGTVLFLIIRNLVLAVSAAPNLPVYVIPGSHHCYSCQNGTKVSNDCVVDWTQSSCESCETHHFQDEPNIYKYCKMCNTFCPKNGVVVQKCTALTDLICQCPDGYHRYPIDHIDPNFDCREHSDCRPGEGEVYYGNFTHDRKCRGCVDGTEFANLTIPAHPVCSVCTQCPGTEIKGCTSLTDTVCDKNSTGSAEKTTTYFTDGAKKQDESSKSNNWLIGILVFWIVLLAIGIVVVFIYKRKGRRLYSELQHSPTLKKGLWIIFFFFSGIVAALCFIFYLKRQQRKKPVVNGQMDDPAEVGLVIGNEPDTEGAQGSPQSTVPKDTQYSQPGGDQVNASNGQPGSKMWPKEFITRDVFNHLSEYLADDWKRFVHNLPWPKNIKSYVKIIHAQEDCRTLYDQIHYVLQSWSQASPEHVTKSCIVEHLELIGLKEIVEQLEEKARQKLTNTSEN